MIQEECSDSASTVSHPASEPGNVRERVETLRQNVNELSKTLEEVDRNLREAAGKGQ